MESLRAAPACEEKRICPAGALKEGGSRKFHFLGDGRRKDGFVVRLKGRLLAYENKCRHLPLSLDCGDNQFLTPDRECFVCQAHGALYDPASGQCISGPCRGESLRKLKVAIRQGSIWLVS